MKNILRSGFQNGLQKYGKEVENLSFKLHNWFTISPWEDFLDVAVDFKNEATFSVLKRLETLFSKHVEYCCLTLVPALQKVEER